jgi:broad specificity phosphatase PhoE
MGEVYFVRHGQASYGTSDYDRLSDLGHVQAGWLGQHLAETIGGFDRIVSGDLRRHRETLAGIMKALPDSQTTEDARFNEMAYFPLEQAYIAANGGQPPGDQLDMAAFFRQVLVAWEAGEIPAPPEAYDDFKTRIINALTEFAAPGERVLIVSSGGPVGVALAHILSLDLHAMTDVILHTHNASYSRFMVHPERLSLIQYNVISHLEAPDRRYAQTYI